MEIYLVYAEMKSFISLLFYSLGNFLPKSNNIKEDFMTRAIVKMSISASNSSFHLRKGRELVTAKTSS